MSFYVVNTNRRDDPSGLDEKQMLDQKMVALYFDGYKEKINTLEEGDTVILYSTGNGIVAFGTATGKTKVRNYKNSPKKQFKNAEHYMPLTDFQKLKSPFTYSEITDVAGKRQNVTKAFFRMNDQTAAKILKQLEIRAHQLRLAN